MKFTKETSSDGFGSACSGRSRLPICSAETLKTAIEGQQVEIVGSADVVDLVEKKNKNPVLSKPNFSTVTDWRISNEGDFSSADFDNFLFTKNVQKKMKRKEKHIRKHHKTSWRKGTCLFLPYLCEFSLGAPLYSHSLQTCVLD